MLCVSIVLLSFSLLAKEQFVVVNVSSVDLLNSRGENSLELPQGTVVKVNSSITGAYEVEVDQEFHSASASSFKAVSSMNSEAKRLKSDINNLNQTINQLGVKISSCTKSVSDLNNKIFELKLWIEVQRDFSFSKESYQARVKGSLEELKLANIKVNRVKLQEIDLLEQEKVLLRKVSFLAKSLELVLAQAKKDIDRLVSYKVRKNG
jgi:chromosome segregation ATPase